MTKTRSNPKKTWAYMVPLVTLLALGGCNTLTVPDFNNPGLAQLDDPVRVDVQLLAQGLMVGARAGMSARAGYISALGILGRESYNFDPSDPRFITVLLEGPLDGGANAFGGTRAGTGSAVILLSCMANVERNTQVKSADWKGTTPIAASKPFTRIEPPLKISCVNPDDGASCRGRRRSLTLRWNTVASTLARPPNSVASMPPSSSLWRSGLMSVTTI